MTTGQPTIVLASRYGRELQMGLFLVCGPSLAFAGSKGCVDD